MSDCRGTNSCYEVKDEDTIFVSIASYRDKELIPTIEDLYENASNPDNIYLGICLQEDSRGLKRFPFYTHPNVNVIKMHYGKAKGVGLARWKCQLLYDEEKYYLQIDSHMRFVKGWDDILIKMINLCTSNKPILSTYPNTYWLDEVENKKYLNNKNIHNIKIRKVEHNHLTHRGNDGNDHSKYDIPNEGIAIAAGYLFTLGRWVEECPYNHLISFRGEEDDLTMRSYSHGWKIYIPTTCVIYHLYHNIDKELDNGDGRAFNKYRPMIHEDVDMSGDTLLSEQNGSITDYLLNIENDDFFGNEMTYDEIVKYIGYDIKTKRVNKSATYGVPTHIYKRNKRKNRWN